MNPGWPEARSSFPLPRDKTFHRQHRGLRWKNLFDQHTMDFFVTVEASVLERDTAVATCCILKVKVFTAARR